MSADNLSAWKTELSRIKTEVTRARKALAKGEIPADSRWTPPSLGQLPRELHTEAERLRSEIEDVNAAIRAAMDKNRSERDRLHRTPQKREPESIYFDVEG